MKIEFLAAAREEFLNAISLRPKALVSQSSNKNGRNFLHLTSETVGVSRNNKWHRAHIRARREFR
ncbi:MAG TPA: hypothetical protein VK747_11310 [Blastocatellia bacterium]|nr:hypothetical protein [Blastocatellia bacterium]